ncbi:MAG: patatin-like phospholipase family protein [Pseudomonadota bacterium]
MAKRKPISLALQGGGAHGAFTWGVLDRLLESDLLSIKAITATSAGAMNALSMVSGLAENGTEGARAALEFFWREVSRRSAPLAVASPPTGMEAINPFTAWTPFSFATVLSNFASPYDLNPFDFNPLRDALEKSINFEAVAQSGIEIHLAATNVETGRVRIFTGEDITLDAALASGCLPQTFKAVEIDGVPYWDGGYLGNPALFPLIYSKAPGDILLVLLNPLTRQGTPKSAGAIQDRLNEISFNSALMSEMRAISFVRKLLDENWMADRMRQDYRRINLHAIRGGQALCDLSLESKYDTRWSFLTQLRDTGRTYADTWLETCYPKVGRDNSVDVREEFLSFSSRNGSAA